MSVLSKLWRWARDKTGANARVAEQTWRTVEVRLPFLDFVPQADRARLRRMAIEFLAAKEISGAHGFAVDDETRLGIALQACLPVLNLGLRCYDNWVGMVVYPADFVIPRRTADEHGVVHEYDEPAAGEAWDRGPVLISWNSAREPVAGDMNVVIHEFAHMLDMLNGDANGMPPLHADMDRAAWTDAFRLAYRDYVGFLDGGGESWLDPYAAASPAEFFAVVSESFFQTPSLVREDMPEVYAQLSRFYRQDPAAGELRGRQAAPTGAADPSGEPPDGH